MIEIKGRSVCGGIAFGPVSIYQKADRLGKYKKIENPEAEFARFEAAKNKAKKDLQGLYEKARKEAGESNAKIFVAHQMILDDLAYMESVWNIVHTQYANAEYAVAMTGKHYAERFANMDDAYMQGRAADIKDISSRVISILQGEKGPDFHTKAPSILLAEDLTPSETVLLDKKLVLSFVTRGGAANTHTSILARMRNIPALIGVDYSDDFAGRMAIVDGFAGKLILDPDDAAMEHYKELRQKEEDKERHLWQLRGKENITKDGRKIQVYANISNPGDVTDVLKNEAGGIGLFRSEFLYLASCDYPTEEAQFQAYKTVAERMAGKKVIVRTLDIGADKQVGYFHLEQEENPALGYRAIRICLDRKEMFQTQLRALYRASYYGTISILFPMIISVDEVKKIKEIIEEAKASLTAQGIPFKEVELGIMIETPAAVFMSRELADEVDFFSIGISDLTQYMLAVDRQNPKLDAMNDPRHPAVLKAIETTVKNGHEGGIWVGICGEFGTDPSLIETFLRMGVDEFSVNPSEIFPIRGAIRKHDSIV